MPIEVEVRYDSNSLEEHDDYDEIDDLQHQLEEKDIMIEKLKDRTKNFVQKLTAEHEEVIHERDTLIHEKELEILRVSNENLELNRSIQNKLDLISDMKKSHDITQSELHTLREENIELVESIEHYNKTESAGLSRSELIEKISSLGAEIVSRDQLMKDLVSVHGHLQTETKRKDEKILMLSTPPPSPVKEKEKRLDSSDADELLSLRCKVASMTEFSEKYDLLQLELENSTRNLTSLASANESEKEIFRLGLCDIGNFLLICI